MSVDAFGAPLNVAAHLPRLATEQPDAMAVAVADGKKEGGFDELTAAALDKACDRAAHALTAAGISRGMKTVLMVKPSPEFFAITFALFKIGAVPVLVDPGMGVKNLGTCLAEAEPGAFVGIPKAHVARMMMGWAKSAKVIVSVGPRVLFSGQRYDKLLDQASDAPFEVADVTSDEQAAILFTSGSTGVPKGAEYTHGIFSSQVRLLRKTYGIEPGERDLSTFPLFALFGPALGMASIVPEMDASRVADADPEILVSAVARYRCTNMFASPALVDKIGRHCAAGGRDDRLASLRRVISAGAPASPAALERLHRVLPEHAPIHTPYGATESLPVADVTSKMILADTREATEAGKGVCVGTIVDEMAVSIIGIRDEPIETWADSLLVEDGEIGEIVVHGPVVTQRYYNREASTKLAKIHDPESGRMRHRMGDLGYVDGQGRLWMCGRKSHRVRAAGGDMYTVNCEAVFNVHESVRRTALVGVGAAGEQRPVLCVEWEAGVSPSDALLEELRAIAKAHPHTERIETFLHHEGFPVDVRHNAKIFREKLAVFAAEKVGQRGAA